MHTASRVKRAPRRAARNGRSGSGRRMARRTVGLLIGLGIFTATLTSAAEAYPACHAVNGVVRDPYSRPVGAANVTTSNPCAPGQPASVTDPVTGSYVISVLGTEAGGSSTLRASKLHYADTEQSVYIDPPETSSTEDSAAPSATYRVRGAEITLYFDVVTALDRPAVQSGNSRTATVRTLAPPPGDPSGHAAKVVVELPDGSTTTLPHTGASDGLNTFAGSVTMPAATTEGTRSLSICAVDLVYASSCSAAAAVVAPTRVSAVRERTLLVDNTAPVFSTAEPGAFDVLLGRTLSASWTDADTDLHAPSTIVELDGSPLPSTTAARSIQASLVGKQLGVHRLNLTVADRAGNFATKSYIFTLAELTGSSATVTLRSSTLPVTPPGGVPQRSVTFTNPVVDVPATTLALPAVTRVGFDEATRGFAFGSVQVVFRNEAGLSTTVTATAPASVDVLRLATVAPSASAVVASFPAHTALNSSFSVAVPTGYTTPGATAQLVAKSAVLGPPTAATSILESRLDGKISLGGSFNVCAKGTLDTQLACTAAAPPSATVGRGGLTYGVPVPVATGPLADPSENDRTPPSCVGCDAPQSWPDGLRQYGGGLAFGCPNVVIAGTAVNLCTGDASAATSGPAAAYLNAFIYASEGHFPAWRQDRSDVSTDVCANGEGGSRTGYSYRVAANTLAADGSGNPLVAGTYVDEHDPLRGLQEVSLGAVTGNDRQGFATQAGLDYTLTNAAELTLAPSGRYVPALDGQWVTAGGPVQASASATSNAWQFRSTLEPLGTGLNEDVQVYMGSDYRAPAVIGTYNFEFNNSFEFLLDSAGCVPN